MSQNHSTCREAKTNTIPWGWSLLGVKAQGIRTAPFCSDPTPPSLPSPRLAQTQVPPGVQFCRMVMMSASGAGVPGSI